MTHFQTLAQHLPGADEEKYEKLFIISNVRAEK